MDQSPGRASIRRPVVFRDGLGRRCRIADAAGQEKFELLCLRGELADVESFETALRDRVRRLAEFRPDSFARLQSVERLGHPSPTLVVVSAVTPGVRLSDLLAVVHRQSLALETGAAFWLIRQLFSAVSLLHQEAADVAHGAIAPERIVVTPDGRLVLVEHVLGGAIEHLRFSPDRYWQELRVACPHSAGLPTLNHRADVTQAGVVALSLLLGRPLEDDEYPPQHGRVEALRCLAENGQREPLPVSLRVWLARVLQLDVRHSFATAIEASAELDTALDENGFSLSSVALEQLLAQCQAHLDRGRRGAAAASAAPAPPAGPPRAAALPGVVPSDDPSRANAALRSVDPISTASTDATGDAAIDEPATNDLPVELADDAAWPRPDSPFGAGPPTRSLAPRAMALALKVPAALLAFRGQDRRRTVVAATLLTVVCGAGWGAASRYFEASAEPAMVAPPVLAVAAPVDPAGVMAPAPALGQLDIRTEPPGATVTVDGTQRGTAPLVLADLLPGNYTVDLANGAGSSRHAVTIEPGATATLTARLPAAPASPSSGWVAVSAPAPVSLFQNGELLGTSQSGRIALPVGSHQVELVNDAIGYRATRTVQIRDGATTSVTVEMPRGTVALNAVPWAEVWIDGRSVGETPIGNLPIAVGEHEIVFRHPDLGEQRVTTTVTLKAPARVSVDLRQP